MRISALLLFAGLASTVACDEPKVRVLDGIRQGESATFRVIPDLHGGVYQDVRLSPAEPRQGDTLHVTSVLRSLGSDVVTARTCGLDLRGELKLRDPYVRCGGYSIVGHPLAGSDSLVEHDGGIVLSAPGRHELQVRHLLEPELWVRVPVTVRP